MQTLFAISLLVPEYDAGIEFYVGTLGFTLNQDEDLGSGKRWVRVTPPGDTGASLILARATDEPQRNAIGNQMGGRVGFFLQTDNFDRDYKAMIARSIHFEEEPRYEPYGIVAVWQDPFGNRWDLIQFT